MADKNLRARVTGLASQALSNPVTKAARDKAFDAAKGVGGAAVTALRNRASGDGGSTSSTSSTSSTDTTENAASTASTDDKGSLSTAEPVGAPAEDTLDSARSDDDETTGSSSGTSTGDDTSSGDTSSGDTSSGDTSSGGTSAPDLLPYPQLEEPVPVVEQALEAERNGFVPVEGRATEPHASTRDEDHGDAQLQPAEQEEIAEEVAEAMPGGDLDLETPVGTTGADVGHNPDTAEADLQQPGTAPGVEPGLASSVRKDEERGLSAARGPDETST